MNESDEQSKKLKKKIIQMNGELTISTYAEQNAKKKMKLFIFDFQSQQSKGLINYLKNRIMDVSAPLKYVPHKKKSETSSGMRNVHVFPHAAAWTCTQRARPSSCHFSVVG